MSDEETITGYHMQDNANLDESTILAAKTNYANKNYREALKLLLDASHKIADAQIYVDIGSCYYMLNNDREAEESWGKAINLDPKSSKAYANLGNLYYKNNQTEKAISYWLVALISRPEDANTCLNLAVAFEKKDMRFEAIKYFERYIKYEENKSSDDYRKVKDRIQYCFNIANQYLVMGAQLQSEDNNKKAAACYFKSLANYPNLSKTNLNLGAIFFSDKNLDLAIKYWKAALYIEPDYDKVYSNLAISYDLKREFDYAYCYYYRYMNLLMNNKEEYYKVNQRLLKLKPFLNEHPELIEKHLKNAQAFLANSQFDDAIDEYKNYSILKPEESANYKELIKKFESYLNPEWSIIETCFEIGNKLINKNNFSEAKPYFWRIMKLSSPQYFEFTKARAKYSQCEKMEAEMHV